MVDIRLDSAGIAKLLRSAGMRAAVSPAARAVAGQARGMRPGADVSVDEYTTDRQAASVTVRDPRALAWQARDGLLTKAAGAVGLTVRSK